MSDGIYYQSPLALALENNCSFSIWNELWWNYSYLQLNLNLERRLQRPTLWWVYTAVS